MYPDLIALSIPFLMGLVIMEFLLDLTKTKKNYCLKEAISNISCGFLEQITSFLSKGLFLLIYAYLYQFARIDTIPLNSTMGWITLVLLVDLIFYVFHKASHRHNILWSAHVVHHEVKQYNLTVALRRSVVQEFLIIPVYLPLAIAGFHPAAFLLILAVHNLYQFWLHASYAPKLKWLGLIFNTPAHHIVHHSHNKCYLDKNFGGIFIFWDKWFGTFEALDAKPEVGITLATKTFNPVKSQFTTLNTVFKGVGQTSSLAGKFRFFWASPATLAHVSVKNRKPKKAKFSSFRSKANIYWGTFLFVFCLIMVSAYRNYERLLDPNHHYYILISLGTILYLLGLSIDRKAGEQ